MFNGIIFAIPLFNVIYLSVFVIAPFTSQAAEHITIKNDSEQTIAFKVKTTAPKVYCVRPNAALVPAGESVDVQVILLGLKEEPTPDFKCKDKFLVIALPAPYDLGELSVAEAWPQLEAEFKNKGLSKKIKVNYQLDAEPRVVENLETDNVQTETVIPSAKETIASGSKATEESASEPVQKKSVPVASANTDLDTEKPKVVESEPKLDEKVKSDTSANTEIIAEPASTSNIAPAVVIWIVIGFLLWYWLS